MNYHLGHTIFLEEKRSQSPSKAMSCLSKLQLGHSLYHIPLVKASYMSNSDDNG